MSARIHWPVNAQRPINSSWKMLIIKNIIYTKAARVSILRRANWGLKFEFDPKGAGYWQELWLNGKHLGDGMSVANQRQAPVLKRSQYPIYSVNNTVDIPISTQVVALRKRRKTASILPAIDLRLP